MLLQSRLTRLEKTATPDGCPVCGAVPGGLIRIVVAPPRAVDRLEENPVTPPDVHCPGCGRPKAIFVRPPRPAGRDVA